MLDKTYNPAEVQAKFYQAWEASGAFECHPDSAAVPGGHARIAQRLGAAGVLVRRNHEAALGDVEGRLHLAKAQQHSGVDRALEHAGHHSADRDLQRATMRSSV